MRRLLAITLVLALLVAVLASMAWVPPADAKKPPKPPTTMAPPETCVFNSSGVLQHWDGSSPFHYRCQWIVEDRSDDPVFWIEDAGGEVEAVSIRGPYLAVTDVYPSGGDICERQYVRQADLPFEHFEAVTLPADGNCAHSDENKPDTDGGDSFALTIGVQKVTPKNGTVQLVWVNYPG